MKTKFLNFRLCCTMLCLAMTALWSCSDSDDSTDSVGPDDSKPVFEVAEPQAEDIQTTSAQFKITVKNVESYVCKVVEGANATQPDPVLVYKEAETNGTIKKVSGNTITETITGLEGKKTYSVFFVWKTEEGFDILSKQVTTANYTQKVTILETGMFHVKVHVEVPEDVYYSLGMTSQEIYIAMQMYGNSDINWVMHDEYSGMASPRFKGPQTITLRDGEFQYAGADNEQEIRDMLTEEDIPYYSYNIKPGTPYVLFMGECDKDGMTAEYVEGDMGGGPDFGPLNANVLPDITEYTEVCPEYQGLKFTGNFAKTRLFTQQADKGPGKVDIVVDRLTEKTAVITLKPTKDVFQYCVMVNDTKTRNEEIYVLTEGEKGMQAFAMVYGDVVEGEQQMYIPMEKGLTYNVYVTAIYNEEGTLQTLDKKEGIAPIVSTKPAAEIQVTALKFDDPYKVGFNIKAPNKDCIAFKYLMNYTHEWYPMMNSMQQESMEANIAAMVNSYGAGVNDAETMAEVNSDKGHDLIFSSMDDTESWIVFETYNEDEKTKLFYDEKTNRSKSGKLQALQPVNTNLMQKLQGTWEASMTNLKGKKVTATVTIGEGPQFIASMPDDVKNKLVNYYVENNKWSQEKAVNMVEKTFEEYKEYQKYYTEKYKSQNYLVVTGLSYDKIYSNYASSWDLFQSFQYSSYSTEEMFRDYGPKFFLQFEEDEKGNISILVPTTHENEEHFYLRYVDPYADWGSSMSLHLSGCNPDMPNNVFMSDFPVKVSDDLNTIIVNPMVQDGVYYTPSIAQEMYGRRIWGWQTDKNGIELKRVADTPTSRAFQMNTPVEIKDVKCHKGNFYKRTRAPYGFTVKEPMHIKVFSMESVNKKIK